MRVVLLEANKLVIHNGGNSIAQARWATVVLVLGFIGIYFLVSKVADNIFYLWLGILAHIICFLFVCWYFAPVITTFDKIQSTVIIKRLNLFDTYIAEYPLFTIGNVQIKKTEIINSVCVIYLLLTSGKRLYLSNSWDEQTNCHKVLYTIKNFL
jgi:hypothetical protein